MNRFVIWLVTILGVLPLGLLSIAALKSQLLLSHLRERPPQRDSVVLMDESSIEIGPSVAKFRLSTENWPAVVSICGILFLFVGMVFLLPGEPQRFYRNGLSRLRQYVDKVIQSRQQYASVTISSPEHVYAVIFAHQGGRVFLVVFADLRKTETSDLPTKIGDFFAKRRILPRTDFQGSFRGLKDEKYHCEVELSADPVADAELLRALFTDVFSTSDAGGLEFSTTGF